MSIDFRSLRTVKPLGVEELQRMHTGTLLKRLSNLRSLQESLEKSDWSLEERDTVAAAGLIAFKDTAIWKQAYSDLKTLLDSREHIDRGGKETRRKAQQRKQKR